IWIPNHILRKLTNDLELPWENLCELAQKRPYITPNYMLPYVVIYHPKKKIFIMYQAAIYEDQYARMYDIKPASTAVTYAQTAVLQNIGNTIKGNAIAVDPTGKYIAVGTDKNIEIYTEQSATLKDFDYDSKSNGD